MTIPLRVDTPKRSKVVDTLLRRGDTTRILELFVDFDVAREANAPVNID